MQEMMKWKESILHGIKTMLNVTPATPTFFFGFLVVSQSSPLDQ